jgi:hypothetical protein
VKAISVDVAVLVVGGGPVECVVAEAIDLDFASPNVRVECLEVVLVDKAKLKCCQLKSRDWIEDRGYVHLLERKGRL